MYFNWLYIDFIIIIIIIIISSSSIIIIIRHLMSMKVGVALGLMSHCICLLHHLHNWGPQTKTVHLFLEKIKYTEVLLILASGRECKYKVHVPK